MCHFSCTTYSQYPIAIQSPRQVITLSAASAACNSISYGFPGDVSAVILKIVIGPVLGCVVIGSSSCLIKRIRSKLRSISRKSYSRYSAFIINTIIEYAITYIFYIFRNCYFLKSGTIYKCTLLDCLQAIRHNDTGQQAAILKCPRANTYYVFGYYILSSHSFRRILDQFQRPFSIDRIIVAIQYTINRVIVRIAFSYVYSFQAITMFKGWCIQWCNILWNI